MPCVLFALLLATQSALPAAPPAPDPAVERMAHRFHAARVRRNLGWALGGVGLGALAVGIVLINAATSDIPTNTGFYHPVLIGGIGAMAAGLGVAISGVVLALQGQSEMNEADWRIKALKTALLSGSHSGFSAGVHFTF